ncbi:hypothetical protein M446_5790 [Methylobacterium sp. 4-46]|uniref:hypothetical protein n=1 Tax=unclassified Methylobacterium TaxID=2615210 RepID=UPI000165CD28|nr:MULTISPECIES: hypothetical protein [Methylobacterium]ACA20078.1 hypothetical protein M446_5790 [Methylobacterium sp. 4-46]WFT79265.1 hypothetical protein QA634_29225 [Methylobacterium nodulans]
MRFIRTLRAMWLLRKANRDLEEARTLREAAEACRARADQRLARAGRLLAGTPLRQDSQGHPLVVALVRRCIAA